MNGFKNIPGKACVKRVHNNDAFVNVGNEFLKRSECVVGVKMIQPFLMFCFDFEHMEHMTLITKLLVYHISLVHNKIQLFELHPALKICKCIQFV